MINSKPTILDSLPSIAVVAHDCVNGGAVGSVAWNQVEQFTKKFNVFVISKNVPETENPRIRAVIVPGKNWNKLGRFAHVPNELSFQKSAKKALENLCQNVDVRAIWCHSHAAVRLAAAPVSARRGIPIVMTTHGDIFERPPGTYDALLTLFYKFVTKKAYILSDRVQVLSPYMGAIARDRGVKESRVCLVPNGVEPAEVGLQKIAQRDCAMFAVGRELKVLFVGSLLPIKGVRHLLKAIAMVRSASVGISLVCIGDGPELAALKQLQHDLDLGACVKFLGKVPRLLLGNHYLNSDILCVPSDSDSLPTVVLEAFCAGLPVVGSDIGGITYMVTKERGFLFKPGDCEELSKVLMYVSKNMSDLTNMSHACSKAAGETYSWSTVGEKLNLLLEDLVNVR